MFRSVVIIVCSVAVVLGQDVNCKVVKLELAHDCPPGTELAPVDIMQKCRRNVCAQGSIKGIRYGLFGGADGFCIQGPHEDNDPICNVLNATRCPKQPGQSVCVPVLSAPEVPVVVLDQDVNCKMVKLELAHDCSPGMQLAPMDIMQKCRRNVCAQGSIKGIRYGLFGGADGFCIQGPHEDHDPICNVLNATRCPKQPGQSVCVPVSWAPTVVHV